MFGDGRYEDANSAAEAGLNADPLAEVLIRDLMEAASATGSAPRVHALMTRLRRQLAENGDANDADDWLPSRDHRYLSATDQ